MDPNQQIALWADQLRDLSATGLIFSDNFHDRENYHRIQEIAMQMLALVTRTSIKEIEPLQTIVFARPSPITTADAAIIDDEGRILLIQRADNHKWAMPGGVCSVGETVSETATREAKEETGVSCETIRLIGIYDSRFNGSQKTFHLYHLAFLCRLIDGAGLKQEPSHIIEILDRAWYRETELPEDIDPGHVKRIYDAFRAWEGNIKVYYE
ncbi:MAG: NUDIX domain-containing protein [Chloroflexota bacterium]|nr:MAG: NUDIX domain-containing protein [Chloroflexota bacterium]